MASDVSKYLGNKFLRWLAGNAMPTAPASVYAALYDGDPKAAGTEVTTTVRVAGRVALSFAALASGVTNELDTNADIDFGNSAGDASVSHIAIYDASTSGNLLWSKQLVGGPYAIATGAAVKFPSGQVTFTQGS